jgi:hypothetical protein
VYLFGPVESHKIALFHLEPSKAQAFSSLGYTQGFGKVHPFRRLAGEIEKNFFPQKKSPRTLREPTYDILSLTLISQ